MIIDAGRGDFIALGRGQIDFAGLAQFGRAGCFKSIHLLTAGTTPVIIVTDLPGAFGFYGTAGLLGLPDGNGWIMIDRGNKIAFQRAVDEQGYARTADRVVRIDKGALLRRAFGNEGLVIVQSVIHLILRGLHRPGGITLTHWPVAGRGRLGAGGRGQLVGAATNQRQRDGGNQNGGTALNH